MLFLPKTQEYFLSFLKKLYSIDAKKPPSQSKNSRLQEEQACWNDKACWKARLFSCSGICNELKIFSMCGIFLIV